MREEAALRIGRPSPEGSVASSLRSAALQQAVRLLRLSELRASYASAWEEATDDDAAWDRTAGDGLIDEGHG
jgi:hypothetical protein